MKKKGLLDGRDAIRPERPQQRRDHCCFPGIPRTQHAASRVAGAPRGTHSPRQVEAPESVYGPLSAQKSKAHFSNNRNGDAALLLRSQQRLFRRRIRSARYARQISQLLLPRTAGMARCTGCHYATRRTKPFTIVDGVLFSPRETFNLCDDYDQRVQSKLGSVIVSADEAVVKAKLVVVSAGRVHFGNLTLCPERQKSFGRILVDGAVVVDFLWLLAIYSC